MCSQVGAASYTRLFIFFHCVHSGARFRFFTEAQAALTPRCQDEPLPTTTIAVVTGEQQGDGGGTGTGWSLIGMREFHFHSSMSGTSNFHAKKPAPYSLEVVSAACRSD